MRSSSDSLPSLHLDASFLIHALVPDSPQAEVLRRWLESGRGVAMSSWAWAELLCGLPDPAHQDLARRIVREHVSVGVEAATDAARLFKLTGRRKGSLSACVVAASAIGTESPLATAEPDDFQDLRAHGLQLGL